MKRMEPSNRITEWRLRNAFYDADPSSICGMTAETYIRGAGDKLGEALRTISPIVMRQFISAPMVTRVSR